MLKSSKGKSGISQHMVWPRSFKGSVRAVCPTPPLQLYLNIQFWERKWNKIMQSNSEEQREKATDISLNVSPEQTQLVVDLWKKKKKKKRLAAGPVIETPWYVHVPCTCNYNLSNGFKGGPKSRKTLSVGCSWAEINGGFPLISPGICILIKDTQSPKSAFSSSEKFFFSSRCEEKYKLTLPRERGRIRGLFWGLIKPSGKDKTSICSQGRGNRVDVDQISGYDRSGLLAVASREHRMMWRLLDEGCSREANPGVTLWFTCRHFQKKHLF